MEINSPPPTPPISIESIPTNHNKKTSGDLWRSPATGHIQFYNQSTPPPKSLYFGEKNVADCYSCSSRTQSIPPQSHQKLLETIGNLQPMQRREFAEQRTFNFLTFFYLSFPAFIPCRESGEQWTFNSLSFLFIQLFLFI